MPQPESIDHAWFRERIAPFVAGGLSPSELARFGAHSADCDECAAELEHVVSLDRSMKEAFHNAQPASGLEDRLVSAFRSDAAVSALPPRKGSSKIVRAEGSRFSPFMQRAAGVCAATVLLGIVWYAIGNSAARNHSTQVAVNKPPPVVPDPPADPKLPRPPLGDIVNEKPTSSESSDVVVPPDVLAKAELGDHFETINPDQPDTHSAMGNPDAHSFHSTEGKADEPVGGGGMNGTGIDDLIGVGGAPAKGTGGGFGGGDGTGVGVGAGSGQGSFGQRNGGGRKLMVKRHGGSKATESAVDKALGWLAAHQELDGHWDAAKHGATEKANDTTVTALSLLAFLGAGHSEKVGMYKDNVKRAVTWLIQQPENASADVPAFVSTLALSEAAGMGNISETRSAAQKRLDGLYGADGKCPWLLDHSEEDWLRVGWSVMMLKSAKIAGLKTNPQAWEASVQFIQSAETADIGVKHFTFGENYTCRTCAIGNLARLFLNGKVDDVSTGVNAFITEFGTPSWDADRKKVDFEYWYFGTLSAFQIGGDTWKHWNEDLKKALVENEVAGGDDAGSWNPVGINAQTRGRVGQTALAALCLQTYYRYVRLDPGK